MEVVKRGSRQQWHKIRYPDTFDFGALVYWHDRLIKDICRRWTMPTEKRGLERRIKKGDAACQQKTSRRRGRNGSTSDARLVMIRLGFCGGTVVHMWASDEDAAQLEMRGAI
jgi:hypothetical protein